MFTNSTRYQLAIALSALLSVGTVLSAAAIDVDAEAALAAASATSQADPMIVRPAAESDGYVLPYPMNRAASENQAPTRFNKVIDRGDTD